MHTLKDSEAWFKETHKIARIGSWDLDIRTGELWWSEQTYHLFDLNPQGQKMTVDLFMSFVHPDDRKLIQEATALVLKPDQFRSKVEYRITLPSQAERYIYEEAQVERDNSGEAVRIVGIIQDVTERKYGEKLLRESEQKFRLLANNTHDWEYWISPQGEYVYISQACELISGYTPDEFISSPNLRYDIVEPAYAELVRTHISQDNNPETLVCSIEFAIKAKNGEKRWIIHHCRPVFGAEGQYLGRCGNNRDITERKQAEIDLQESHNQLDSIFRVAPSGIGVVVDRKIKFVNNRFVEMLGYSEAELIGSYSRMVYHSDAEFERVGKEKYAQISELGTGTVETVLQKKDGTLIDVLLSSTPLNLQDLSQGVTFTALDITARKQAEMIAERRLLVLTEPTGSGTHNIRFEDLFNIDEVQQLQDDFALAVGAASIITHPDGTPITKPSNFSRLCKIIRSTEKGCHNCHKSDAVIGRFNAHGPTVQACLSGGLWDAGATICVDGKHIASWLVGQVRNESQTEDGMRSYAREIGVDEADFIKAFYLVPSMSLERFENIAQALFTLSKQLSATAYQNVQQAQVIAARKLGDEALTAREKQLRQIIDQVPYSIFVKDETGRYEIVNKAIADRFGTSVEDLTGRMDVEFVTTEEELANFRADDLEVISSGRSKFIPEEQITDFENKVRFFQTTKVPFEISGGEKNAVLGIAVDITERKKAEVQRLNLEKQLSQKHKMEAVGLMAGGMAHNFNNNLAIILGNLELSKMKLSDDSQIGPFIDNAKIATLRSRDLVQQIQAYSRNKQNEKISVVLPLIIQETVKLLRSTIPSTICLQQTGNADITINGDPSQIQEVLINLCNNAIQAMAEKGTLAISLARSVLRQEDIPVYYSCVAGNYAKISVSDTGTGMSGEIQQKIFDPFFTTKEVGEGTGMGLSTVQGIVSQHGGAIKVTSEIGVGTTFDLYLPIIENRLKESLQKISISPSGTEKILFLDDEEMLVNIWSKMLRQYGYQVTAMTDSRKALELFKNNPAQFDLVISDQTMPILCGKEFFKEIISIRPGMPTIISTGYTTQVTEEEAKHIGITAFCMKPLELPLLLQTIRQVLDDEKG